jgi:hypothetical protein
MSEIGFVVVSHANPEQLLRLTRRLESMFPGSQISCAHDFGQTPLDSRSYPAAVSFVQPYVSTRWGHISVIHAAMRALRALYEKRDPNWFVLLSGSDYPVVTASKILNGLKTSGYDAYLDFRAISYPGRIPWSLDNREVYEFNDPKWTILGYDRYVAKLIEYPSLSKRLRPKWRKLFIRHPWLAWPFHPFRSHLRCFGGEHWYTANRRVAQILLTEYERGERLLQHFSKRLLPDEAFYQTVICNHPGLRLSPDNKRYTDWSLGGAHCKLLDVDDLPAIVSSSAHFARKFQPDSPVLDLLDRVIDQ